MAGLGVGTRVGFYYQKRADVETMRLDLLPRSVVEYWSTVRLDEHRNLISQVHGIRGNVGQVNLGPGNQRVVRRSKSKVIKSWSEKRQRKRS